MFESSPESMGIGVPNPVGEPEQERQVQKRVGNELLSRIFGVTSVTQALEYIQQTKDDEVEDQVFAHCKSFFARQEEQPQALKMLLDGSRGDNEDRIRLAYPGFPVRLLPAYRGLAIEPWRLPRA